MEVTDFLSFHKSSHHNCLVSLISPHHKHRSSTLSVISVYGFSSSPQHAYHFQPRARRVSAPFL